MNVWLVTIGSSDVQLQSDEHWSDWSYDIKKSLDGIQFEPTRSINDEGEPYRLPARVLGIAYDQLADEIWEYLRFPLLDAFIAQLKEMGTTIDQIIILMSDQSAIFSNDDRQEKRCPYWQDTCLLQPILERYFQTSEQLSETEIMPLVLSPDSPEAGLDDWDAVLKLVREKFQTLAIAPETIYVSHQAGTPAISSAVQFSSLAQFSDRVQFLVSNEYRPEQTRTIASSEYLSAIRLQEAKALLARYDYVGAETLLRSYLNAKNPQHKQLQILLKAAIEWNHAEFHKFKNILAKTDAITQPSFPWWRAGYESAYLAVIRLRQGNTVEALFHSFRAIEGTVIKWAKHHYAAHINEDPKYGTQIKSSIVREAPNFKQTLSVQNQERLDRNNLGLFGVPLYNLLKAAKPQWKQHRSIQVVWDSAKEERNKAFHNIEGLQESEVFDAWQTKDFLEWSQCLCDCLNFITDQTMPSLEDASLMVQVHHAITHSIHLIGGEP